MEFLLFYGCVNLFLERWAECVFLGGLSDFPFLKYAGIRKADLLYGFRRQGRRR